MRPMIPEDIYNLKFVSEPQISKDGQSILFTVTQTKGKNEYSSSIWRYEEEKLAPVVSNFERASNPLWSSNGKNFLFLSMSTKIGKSCAQIWVADRHGLNLKKIVDLTNSKIINPQWSRDSKDIFFLSDYCADRGPEPKSDVRVITRMNYRFDGEGYFGNRRPHIFKVHIANKKMQRVTSGEFDVSYFDLSPDGRKVAFVSNTHKDADFQNNMDLYTIPVSGGSIEKLVANKGPITSISYSPDGKSIAFIADDYRYRFNTPAEVRIYNLKSKKITNISRKLDRPARNSIVSDVMMDKWEQSPAWSSDSKEVCFTATDRGKCNVYSGDIDTSTVKQMTSGGNIVTSFSISRNGSIALVRMDPTHPPELFLLRRGSHEPVKISDFNDRMISDVKLSAVTDFTFRARDGKEIHGFFMSPTKKTDRKPPCIVEIHGGGGTEGFQFDHEFQCLAAAGFAVLTCNFRGTPGYGEEFSRVLTGHYMEKDYSDIIDMTMHAIRMGWIDKNRLGVTGGSYGGYLTNWTVGHSKLFAAAVTDRSVVNLYSFYGTSDDYRLIEEDVQMSFPWDRPSHYLTKSPINYTKKMNTPLLIMHSEQDFRCRLEQAEQLYAFLKRQGKEVLLVIFPEESHGLSRSGKPHHRVERLKFMLWWFTSHIKTGKRIGFPI